MSRKDKYIEILVGFSSEDSIYEDDILNSLTNNDIDEDVMLVNVEYIVSLNPSTNENNSTLTLVNGDKICVLENYYKLRDKIWKR